LPVIDELASGGIKMTRVEIMEPAGLLQLSAVQAELKKRPQILEQKTLRNAKFLSPAGLKAIKAF